MFYCGFSKCDLANGPGARVSLFVSGCTVHCKGCFSVSSWDFHYGQPFTPETRENVLNALSSDYITGLSILGGDPLEPENIATVIELCKQVKNRFPDKTIWLWTGRTKRKVQQTDIINYVDVIISEPYIEKLQCTGKYFGSSNQKIWWAKTGECYDDQLVDQHNSKRFIKPV